MIVKKLIVESSCDLCEFVKQKLPEIGYEYFKQILRNKDVKVNSKRVSLNVKLIANDVVEIYYKDNFKCDFVYEDENILVVNKPRQIEVVSQTGESLLDKIQGELKITLYAVHRLDRNTTGLVVFAKNIEAKNELNYAFKNRTLEKFYYALLCGTGIKKQDSMIAYLKKDKNNSLVSISDKPLTGYEKIITNYKLKKEINNDLSLVDVELVTGKTHQIRAHFEHIGFPVLGDEKYGYSDYNKKYKVKFQCLCAYKIIFHFEKNCKLSYLNDKNVQISTEFIDFLQKIK